MKHWQHVRRHLPPIPHHNLCSPCQVIAAQGPSAEKGYFIMVLPKFPQSLSAQSCLCRQAVLQIGGGVILLVSDLRDTGLKSSIPPTIGILYIFPYFLFKQWRSTLALKRTWELLKLPLIPKPHPRPITWEFLGWDAGISCLKLPRWF